MWSSGAGRPDRLDARSARGPTRFAGARLRGAVARQLQSARQAERVRASSAASRRSIPVCASSTCSVRWHSSATQPGLDAANVALVGWSHGGSTMLEAVNGKDAQVAQFYARRGRADGAARGSGVLSRLRRVPAQGGRVATRDAARTLLRRARRLEFHALVRTPRRIGQGARRQHDRDRLSRCPPRLRRPRRPSRASCRRDHAACDADQGRHGRTQSRRRAPRWRSPCPHSCANTSKDRTP